MNAALLINEAATAGIVLHLDGDRVRWKASTPPSSALIERLRAAKPVIIAHLQGFDAQRHEDGERVPRDSQVRPSADGPVAPGVHLDEDGMPIFDTSNDAKLGNGIMACAVRNQRGAMVAAAERAGGVAELRSSRSEDQALERASMAVDPALADDRGEVWLRGEVDG